jgi:hypothetical protein
MTLHICKHPWLAAGWFFRKYWCTKTEKRYYCFAKLEDGIITVRFTYRNGKIRIFGAGYWRKGKKAYEKKNKLFSRSYRQV